MTRTSRRIVATIGYEGTTVTQFLDALHAGGVELVVDVRAVASSRRPGFAKTRLAANLEQAGIGYLHLRGLGTPSDGRAAARSGQHAEMQRIFREHLDSDVAQADMRVLADVVAAPKRACLMCFEADPRHCHRNIVAEALAQHVDIEVVHLAPAPAEPD